MRLTDGKLLDECRKYGKIIVKTTHGWERDCIIDFFASAFDHFPWSKNDFEVHRNYNGTLYYVFGINYFTFELNIAMGVKDSVMLYTSSEDFICKFIWCEKPNEVFDESEEDIRCFFT